MTPSTPFTDPAPTSLGTLYVNEVINDDANGRWILHTTVYDAGSPLNPADTGNGSNVASFRVVGKGTSNAIQAESSIYFVNEPATGWVTTFQNDSVKLPFDYAVSNVSVQPRGIVEGVAKLQGRNISNALVTMELRNLGSYVTTTDTSFINSNDADADAEGTQVQLDNAGKFTLWKVPTGEWSLVISYPRYLAKANTVTINPGLDTLFVNFATMLGGDCAGYVDDLGNAYPDNQIDGTDLNKIAAAYLSTSDSTKWTDGTNNYKWCDINEDGKVYIEDLSMATGNSGNGAQPIYKPVVQPLASNLDAIIEIMNAPTYLNSGKSYMFQVVVRNAREVVAYHIDVSYDKNMFDFVTIEKGDFFTNDSFTIPVVGENKVGLANASYGNLAKMGDGVLAEVTFTANHDGIFNPNMINITEAAFVNRTYMKETIVMAEPMNAAGNVPAAVKLDQNFPNPFNPTTTINYSVPENSNVTLKVYDILGRHVRTLVDGNFAPGSYNIVWDATDMNGNGVSAGLYFYTLKAGNHNSTKRMLLLK